MKLIILIKPDQIIEFFTVENYVKIEESVKVVYLDKYGNTAKFINENGALIEIKNDLICVSELLTNVKEEKTEDLKQEKVSNPTIGELSGKDGKKKK